MANRYVVELTLRYHGCLLDLLSRIPPKSQPARLAELAEHGAVVVSGSGGEAPPSRLLESASPAMPSPAQRFADSGAPAADEPVARYVLTLVPRYHPTLIELLERKPLKFRRTTLLCLAERAAALDIAMWGRGPYPAVQAMLDGIEARVQGAIEGAIPAAAQQVADYIAARFGEGSFTPTTQANTESNSDKEEGGLSDALGAACSALDLGAEFDPDQKKSDRKH